MDLTRIPINIWDDYDGSKRNCETDAVVEEHEVLTKKQKIAILKRVVSALSTLKLGKVRFERKEDWIGFVNLRHPRREKLVEELNAMGLTYNGVPFDFYSES